MAQSNWNILKQNCFHPELDPVGSFLSHQGPLAIDESIQLCQSVCSGNPRTLCWFMLPQWHSSTKKETVIRNRRMIEDKVYGSLALTSVNFLGSAFCFVWLFPSGFPMASQPLDFPCLRLLDVYEVAVNFSDSVHMGDRRKKSQQWPWGYQLSMFCSTGHFVGWYFHHKHSNWGNKW